MNSIGIACRRQAKRRRNTLHRKRTNVEIEKPLLYVDNTRIENSTDSSNRSDGRMGIFFPFHFKRISAFFQSFFVVVRCVVFILFLVLCWRRFLGVSLSSNGIACFAIFFFLYQCNQRFFDDAAKEKKNNWKKVLNKFEVFNTSVFAFINIKQQNQRWQHLASTQIGKY